MSNRSLDSEQSNLITKNNPKIIEFFASLDCMLDDLEKMSANCKPTLNGERYITDRELSERLNISRRALQEYRNDGRIPYYQIGAKILYRESDIRKVLETHYKKAFK